MIFIIILIEKNYSNNLIDASDFVLYCSIFGMAYEISIQKYDHIKTNFQVENFKSTLIRSDVVLQMRQLNIEFIVIKRNNFVERRQFNQNTFLFC